MSQNFDDIQATDYIDTSIVQLQDRDNAVLTCFCGINAPSNPFEDLIWNDLTEHKFKRYNNDSWDVIIDYSQEYVSKNKTDSDLQPINSTLSSYSSVTTQSNECGFVNNSWISISYFALNNLLNNCDYFNESISIKELGTTDKLSSNNIENGSITENMIDSSIMLSDSPYKIGDIIPSFNSSTKKGCVKLSKSESYVYTVGGISSNSTYMGDTYKNLYKFIWESLNLPVYASSGSISSKGETWLSDWDNNKKLELPHIDSPNSNKPEDFLITRAEEGEYIVPKSGYYEIKLTGGGGGGAFAYYRYYMTIYNRTACCGASGGGLLGKLLLEEDDTLFYVIGSGGIGGKNNLATSGENSSLLLNDHLLSECSGGKPGARQGDLSGGTVINLDTENFIDYEIINGANGIIIQSSTDEVSVLGPFDNYWGAGGSAKAANEQNYYANDGSNGALFIHYIGPKEYGTTDPNLIHKYDLLNESLTYFMKY